MKGFTKNKSLMKNIIFIISIVLIGLVDGIAQEKLYYSYSQLSEELSEEVQKDNRIGIKLEDSTETQYANIRVYYENMSIIHFLFSGFDPSSLVHKTIVYANNEKAIKAIQKILKSDYVLMTNRSWKLKDSSIKKFCYLDHYKGHSIYIFSLVEL